MTGLGNMIWETENIGDYFQLCINLWNFFQIDRNARMREIADKNMSAGE